VLGAIASTSPRVISALQLTLRCEFLHAATHVIASATDPIDDGSSSPTITGERDSRERLPAIGADSPTTTAGQIPARRGGQATTVPRNDDVW
jgi:hypothetical protein